MSKQLHIFISVLIALGLVVLPLRVSWSGLPVQSADSAPSCHMAMDDTQAMLTDTGIQSDSETMPPCCRDHCYGCDGDCHTGSPVNVALPFASNVPITPDSPVNQEAASLVASTTPEPLLRPPPARYS